MPLSTNLFDYPLPDSAIAQHPAQRRDYSRLMVVHRKTRAVEHRHFYELPEILSALPKKAAIFRNNAKVIKARLFLERAGGGKAEVLLLRPAAQSVPVAPELSKGERQKYPASGGGWWCLAKPLKKMKIGDSLFLSRQNNALPRPISNFQSPISVAILKEKSDSGEALFEFAENPLELSERIGALPLPPYIAREKGNEPEDGERYQTVYAREPVAAAAPTAGLHFTPELLERLRADGHLFADVTLHVGLDTFRPIGTPTIEEHKIHRELYTLSGEAATALTDRTLVVEGGAEEAEDRTYLDRFYLAVGTTSLRAMEDFWRKGCPVDCTQEASTFIYPPQTVVAADALITNFHLPKSTLLCLVSAFLAPRSLEGIDWLKELYAEALQRGYRFYSYGDAMLIL